MGEAQRAGPIGRTLRAIAGALVVITVIPVFLRADRAFNLRSLGVIAGLALFYTLLHLVVARLAPNLNRWLGAVLAILPVVIVWYLGQGGALLFGRGEGGMAAVTYVGASLLIDAARADAGCEVMALPGLLAGRRTHLACLVFSPIDALEGRLTGR